GSVAGGRLALMRQQRESTWWFELVSDVVYCTSVASTGSARWSTACAVRTGGAPRIREVVSRRAAC
ncbi:MAG TPA: hypothetical protein VLT45_13820, partial [Kofleriaceae bacterium]|nr:hypothetical protein [Kofleriaceae bacterium]